MCVCVCVVCVCVFVVGYLKHSNDTGLANPILQSEILGIRHELFVRNAKEIPSI